MGEVSQERTVPQGSHRDVPFKSPRRQNEEWPEVRGAGGDGGKRQLPEGVSGTGETFLFRKRSRKSRPNRTNTTVVHSLTMITKPRICSSEVAVTSRKIKEP